MEEVLKPKSRVLYFLVESPPLPLLFGGKFEAALRQQVEKIKARRGAPLRILWNHRWDYDKNPVDFFRVIFELAGIDVPEDFFDLGKVTLRPSVGDAPVSEVSASPATV